MEDLKNDFILVSPDAGASHKIYKLAEQIGYKGDIITCSKERDKEGKLSKVTINGIEALNTDKDCIILDDICDGGATFINIAKKLISNRKECGGKGKLYLIVTHGIFSKGFEELSRHFDGIYCTNSYSDLPKGEKVKEASQYICKQLNVF